MSNFVYILKCSDQSFYTGWTNNLKKRVKTHNAGKGSHYTRARRPVSLIYFEEYPDKISAMKREYSIKQLSRKKKEELIKKGSPAMEDHAELLNSCNMPNNI